MSLDPVEFASLLAMPHSRHAKLIVRLFPGSLRSLMLQLREDYATYHRDWTVPGFRAVAVHRFGEWVKDQTGRGFVRGPIAAALGRLHLAMFRYIRNHYGLELAKTVVLGRRVLLAHQAGIVIHPFATIGDDCLIHQNVTIGALTVAQSSDAPTLGVNVQVGCGAAILGRVTIGDGARIGPNAVVMTDVPAGATVFVNTPRTILTMRTQVKRAERSDPVTPGATR